jgi:hypothetical protein
MRKYIEEYDARVNGIFEPETEFDPDLRKVTIETIYGGDE